MSGYSEDDIRRAADIREWLVKQIADKQEEVERLRAVLSVIDGLLKQGSFRAAASLDSLTAVAGSPAVATAQIQQVRDAVHEVQPRQQGPSALKAADDRDLRPLKRAKDEFVLASAEVSPASVVIVPAQGITLNVNTPPFRSFFLNRILDGMKNKDAEKITQGSLKASDALTYRVEDDNGNIRRIMINNYRDKERLQEIFNTSTWVFTRMLEKTSS
jgi:hypothetical protein